MFKRSLINLRPLFRVKKEHNPKGLGLFLIGYCNLYVVNPKAEYLQKINSLAIKLIEMQTQGCSRSCWGYNFDWRARAFYQPKYTPTVVATTFIAEALLEAYDIAKSIQFLDIAISASKFVIEDLNRTYDDE